MQREFGLVRRPRGGRRPLPATPSPRISPRFPLHGPHSTAYRDNADEDSVTESLFDGNTDDHDADYDPDDYQSVQFYRSNSHNDGNTNHQSHRNVRPKHASVYLRDYCCMLLLLGFLAWSGTLVLSIYYPEYGPVRARSNIDYEMTQDYVAQSQQGKAILTTVKLVHLSDKVNITEEFLLAGSVCPLNEAHAKMSGQLGKYLYTAPAPPSRVHDNDFMRTLSSFNRSFVESSPTIAHAEYMLCLYTEIDVVSNFAAADGKLSDLQVFSNLYKDRLQSIQVELGQLEEITHGVLDQSQTLRKLAAGCGGYVGQPKAEDPVCEFFDRYKRIDLAIQRQYSPLLPWYTKMKALTTVAQTELSRTIEVLGRYASQEDVETTNNNRSFAAPFIRAMQTLIVTAKAKP